MGAKEQNVWRKRAEAMSLCTIYRDMTPVKKVCKIHTRSIGSATNYTNVLSSLIYSDIYLNTFCFDTNSTRTLCSLNLNNNIILGSLFLSCLLGVGLTVLMIAAVFYLRRHFSLATFYPNHVKLFSKADM